MKNLTQYSNGSILNSEVCYSVDCNFKHLRRISQYLMALGYKIADMRVQKSHFLGYTLRIYFSKPVPSSLIQILAEYLMIESPAQVALHSN